MTTEKKLTGYPSIDKPWLKFYSEEAINKKYQNVRFMNICGKTTRTILMKLPLSTLDEKLHIKRYLKILTE